MPHLSTPVTATFEYVDANGIETRRTVDIYRTAKAAGYTRITGWCHGRQAERSFRSDRLQAVITEDGEVLSAGEFLSVIIPGRSGDVAMANLTPSAEEEEGKSLAEIIRDWFLGVLIVAAIYLWATKGWQDAVTLLSGLLLFWILTRAIWRRVQNKGWRDD